MKRALVLSALAEGTGCELRARYLGEALGRLGWQSRSVAPAGKPLPLSAEFMLSLPRFLGAGLREAGLAVGVKPYPNVWMGLVAARWRGAVTVVDVDDADGGFRGPWAGALTRVLQAPALNLAHFASTHHPGIKAALVERLGAERVLDLPQGVDVTRFDPQRWPKRKRSTGPRLGFAAHLNVACQLDVLLAMLGPWLRCHPNAELVVAGGGPDESRFRSLAKPLGVQVRFLGGLSPDGVAEALAACDVGVAAFGGGPGNLHRVPMKVGEYLALGLPVVTNLISGLAELSPYLITADLDPASFSAALDKALRPGARKLSARGQAYVRRHLAWDKVAEGLLQQLHSRGVLDMGSV